MNCVVIQPIHLRGQRVEPSADPRKPVVISLDRSTYDHLRKHGCVRLIEEHETLTQAQAEADRYVEEARAAAEKEREAKLAEARELAEQARIEAEAGAPEPDEPAPDDAPKRARRPR